MGIVMITYIVKLEKDLLDEIKLVSVYQNDNETGELIQ